MEQAWLNLAIDCKLRPCGNAICYLGVKIEWA